MGLDLERSQYTAQKRQLLFYFLTKPVVWGKFLIVKKNCTTSQPFFPWAVVSLLLKARTINVRGLGYCVKQFGTSVNHAFLRYPAPSLLRKPWETEIPGFLALGAQGKLPFNSSSLIRWSHCVQLTRSCEDEWGRIKTAAQSPELPPRQPKQFLIFTSACEVGTGLSLFYLIARETLPFDCEMP